uniref:Uncharacterized protein n=1 Tax=Kalanchoe fedtschenkoi TaxID=63787 RepID=A0A7N0VBZ0_KALFE
MDRLSAVVLILICVSSSTGSGDGSVWEQREFDYFKLALQWPPTYCRKTKHCCSSNACCRGANAPHGFTIHGLWPDYNDGTWPSCCTHSTFNQKEISTLLNALETYWPSLSCGSISNCFGRKGSFWAHEVVNMALVLHQWFKMNIIISSQHSMSSSNIM